MTLLALIHFGMELQTNGINSLAFMIGAHLALLAQPPQTTMPQNSLNSFGKVHKKLDLGMPLQMVIFMSLLNFKNQEMFKLKKQMKMELQLISY